MVFIHDIIIKVVPLTNLLYADIANGCNYTVFLNLIHNLIIDLYLSVSIQKLLNNVTFTKCYYICSYIYSVLPTWVQLTISIL